MTTSFDDLCAFAATHAPTREWIERVKDEVVVEIVGHSGDSTGRSALLRNVVEDLLVCGAACLIDGELVDVATVSLIVDAYGMQPAYPAPTYTQTIGGHPYALYIADRVKYIRLPRDGAFYSASPVEKVMGLREVIRRAEI